MAGRITAREHRVGEIFGDAFRFGVPGYQRPYAWRKEQAAAMLRDLLDAAAGAGPAPYFLGSIVVVKPDGRPDAEIVDGQQRLATLLILLSVLREQASPAMVARVNALMFGGDGAARFRPRAQDQQFFETYIQRHTGHAALRRLTRQDLSESQRHIAENARHFRARLTGKAVAECDGLVRYIDTLTYLVVVSTPEFESAYRTFTVLNERGLDLTHADILKSEVIGRIPHPEQESYGLKWEQQEERLGRHDFGRLFGHIRATQLKRQTGASIVEDIRAEVLPRFADPRVFIDEVLLPMADAFMLLDQEWLDGSAGPVETLVRWLHATGSQDWMPAALAFHTRFGRDAGATVRFLADLERLTASMVVRNFEQSQRADRYGRVVAEIEADKDLHAARSALQLGKDEQAGTLRRLGGDLSGGSRSMRLYLLQRLESLLPGGSAVPRPHATVEHVLPQSPGPHGQWRKAFSNAERTDWLHRLGNLTLLTKQSNVAVANQEYAAKRAHYAALPDSARFVLTTQAFAHPEWTPAVVKQRHARLVGRLATLWRLR